MITIRRLTEFKRSWVLQTVDGLPVDVTGAQAQLVIIHSFDNPEVVFSCDETDYVDITAAEGLFECVVPGSVFDVAAGDYAFYFKVVLDPTGSPSTGILEEGHLTVLHLED